MGTKSTCAWILRPYTEYRPDTRFVACSACDSPQSLRCRGGTCSPQWVPPPSRSGRSSPVQIGSSPPPQRRGGGPDRVLGVIAFRRLQAAPSVGGMTSPFVAVPSWHVSDREPTHRLDAQRTGAVTSITGAAGAAVDGAALDGTAQAAGDDVVHGERSGGGGAGAGSSGQLDLAALGPLAPFAASGPVTDLLVNGERGLWIDRGGGAEHEPGWAADEGEVRALAVRLIARGGRHIDEATPAVDVRLGRGIRVHAVLPPVSSNGTLISVRVPRAAGFSLAALARAGMLDATQEATLRRAVAERRNVLVTGAGGTGKTTMLGAMLGAAPHRERIVLI